MSGPNGPNDERWSGPQNQQPGEANPTGQPGENDATRVYNSPSAPGQQPGQQPPQQWGSQPAAPQGNQWSDAGPTQQWGSQPGQPAQPAGNQWGQQPPAPPASEWGATQVAPTAGGQWGQQPPAAPTSQWGANAPQSGAQPAANQWGAPQQPNQWGAAGAQPGQQGANQWGGQQPPSSPSGKKSKTPLFIGIGVLALVVIGALIAAYFIFFSTPKFDQGALQDGVAKILKDSYGAEDVKDVECPSDQKAEKDAKFECKAKVDGEDKTIAVTVTNDDGEYEVARPK